MIGRNNKKLQKSVLPKKPDKIFLAKPKSKIDIKKIFFLLLGVLVFLLLYYMPSMSDAIDPAGKHFKLTSEGKAALGLFFMASIWWVTEVLPIGITSIAIAVVQALFLIRDPRVVFTDFMDPSVWFIFASLMIGLAFTRTGLTQRMAYKMLYYVGERTSMIYLGSFIMVATLTLIMAHTAVAAAMFPLFMTIYTLYEPENKTTKFGKGLFIGMAFVAGAGSIITLLGAARGAVAIGFFKQMITNGSHSGREIGFFEFSYYLFPVGIIMVILIWIFLLIVFKPEKKRIEGLKDQVQKLSLKMGTMKRNEILTLAIVAIAILILSLRSFVDYFQPFDKSAILLLTTLSFFILNILSVKDLEEIPWQTGAASWLAIHWLVLFKDAHWFLFVLGISFFVLIMTNFIMNVAAIAISLPVALVIAPYLGVAPEVILFACLVTAGMPFLFLIGAAPNAIAYESKQFSSGEFFKAGIPMSLILLAVLSLFVIIIWPLMGMPVLIK